MFYLSVYHLYVHVQKLVVKDVSLAIYARLNFGVPPRPQVSLYLKLFSETGSRDPKFHNLGRGLHKHHNHALGLKSLHLDKKNKSCILYI